MAVRTGLHESPSRADDFSRPLDDLFGWNSRHNALSKGRHSSCGRERRTTAPALGRRSVTVGPVAETAGCEEPAGQFAR